jgi:hypothetical protein
VTTTLQIEQRLSALGGAEFQRLCDAYLRQRGIESYLSIGLTVGRAKTRTGTPDSLASEADGHTFVEATTQVEALGSKLAEDVGKCLDPDKTGVPIARIRRIYLFFTGHLDADEIEALYALARPHGITLILVGPHELADDLRYRFASLAREYLNLSIDTGQVLDPETFVQRHSSTAIQTDLDTRFVGREQELATLATHLSGPRRPAVLLTGPAGVGKTRLALEAALRARVTANPTTVLCVRSRGADAAADLQVALERSGRYLLVFDDSNRLVNLAGLLDVVLEARPDREVRILLTARDYVAEDVRQLLRERGETEVVSLSPLSDEVLRKLLEESFEIRNHLYQRRILEIAAGNARLAIMTARVALATQDLRQLHDATDVYRRFFDPLQRECPIITTPEGLRALGVLALVGQLDIRQEELSDAVGRLHGLEPKVFWSTLEALDDLELVDLFENEVARVTDQTLAAYILFLALFERRVLSLTDVLLELYPRARESLLEALGSVVRAFRGEAVAAQLNAAVNEVWDKAARDWPADLYERFVLTFADARPAEALTLALARLEAAPAEPEAPPGPMRAIISFQASANDAPTLLLGRFRDDEGLRAIALGALLSEARRHPSRIPVLLRLAWERYGFSSGSDWENLGPERDLVDHLWQAAAGDELIAAPMFIAVAGQALRTEHDGTSAGRGQSITFTRFHLPTTRGVRALRDDLWERLATLFDNPALRPLVRDVISTYARGGLTVQERTIVAADLGKLEPLLLARLDPAAPGDVLLVRLLRQVRGRFDLGIPPTYGPFLRTPRARLAELLLRDPTGFRRLGWQAAAAKRTARLQRFGEKVDATRLAELSGELAELLAVYTDHDAYQICEGATTVLVSAATSKPEAVAALVSKWIAGGNPLNLGPTPLINALSRATDTARTWELVTTSGPSPARDEWVAAWLHLLPPDRWTLDHALFAADLLRGASLGRLWRPRDLLDRICATDAASGAAVLRTLVARMSAEPGLAQALRFDFYDGSILSTPTGAVLAGNPDLFGDLYLALEASDRHIDLHAALFDALLSLDSGFGVRWVDQILGGDNHRALDGDRDYSVLWRRDDWAAVLGPLARQILGDDRGSIYGDSLLSTFLRLPDGTEHADVIISRQDALLGDLIRENANDSDRLQRLFYALAHLPTDRRLNLIGVYLALEPPVEQFTTLTLEPTSWSWSGSEVPLLERRKTFFADLVSRCNRPALLAHRAKLEEELRSIDRQIVSARREDFREQRYR